MVSHSNNANFGFRIVGDCRNDRRLIDWPSAFLAYSDCDDRAEVNGESYLSAFCFGAEFRDHLNEYGSPKGYAGPTRSDWLWFDIDNEDILEATKDAQKLAVSLIERFEFSGDQLLIFFSGSKGYHIGLPTSLFNAEMSATYHTQCRKFAEAIGAWVGVTIDSGVYDRVRAFRAPNSRHPKTGRHKRILMLDELLVLPPGRIIELAENPEPFELPVSPVLNRQAVQDWQSAGGQVEQQQAIKFDRGSVAKLNRSTRQFMFDGATAGDRHRALFSAAANLAEFGCSFELAHALLSEAALDSGLPPSEVRRQIQCGLDRRPTS